MLIEENNKNYKEKWNKMDILNITNKNKNMSKSVVDAYQKKKKSNKYTPAKNTKKSRK